MTIQNYTKDKFVLDDSKGGPGSRNKSGSPKVHSCYGVIDVIEVTNDRTRESIYEGALLTKENITEIIFLAIYLLTTEKC